MPIRRRKYGRRIRFRRGRASFRRRLRRNSRFVKRVVRRLAETKLAITQQQGNDFGGSTGLFKTYNLFPTIATGALKNQRIGTRIRTKRLTMRMFVGIPASVGSGRRRFVRVALIVPRGSVLPLNLTDVWTASGSIATTNPPGGLVTFNSPFNTDNFHVLRDWRFVLGVNADVWGAHPQWYKEISIPYVRNVVYNAATTNVKPEVIPYLAIWSDEDLNSFLDSAVTARLSWIDV